MYHGINEFHVFFIFLFFFAGNDFRFDFKQGDVCIRDGGKRLIYIEKENENESKEKGGKKSFLKSW